MVDSVADWSLRQVVDYLQEKDKESNHLSGDDRVYSRSSIRMLDPAIAALAEEFGLTPGRMCRILSYHGVLIMENNLTIQGLVQRYKEIRRLAVEKDSPDIADILNSLIPYTPLDVNAAKTSHMMYDSWVLSNVSSLLAPACGVYPGQLAQVMILRSILTCDLPVFEAVVERLSRESRRWDTWMSFRLSVLEGMVANWESVS
jgi:hypothetical protein